jgi:hypothetical protein
MSHDEHPANYVTRPAAGRILQHLIRQATRARAFVRRRQIVPIIESPHVSGGDR